MSDSNRTALYFVEEATWGVTPVTSATPLQQLRYTGESLAMNIGSVTSAEIRADRMISDLIQTESNPSGGFNFEMSCQALDPLLKGALWSDWYTTATTPVLTTDATVEATLTNGLVEKPYTFVRVHEDVVSGSDPLCVGFRGMVCNTLNLNIASGSVINGSFDYIGKGSYATYGIGTGDDQMGYSLATTTDAPTYDVLNAVTDITTSTIYFDVKGTAHDAMSALSGVFIQDLSISINNNVRGLPAVGVLGNCDLGVGNFDVTGTMNSYLVNKDMLSIFLDNTPKSFAFKVSDGTHQSYTFYFPHIQFESEGFNASGLNSDVVENIGWKALYDPTQDCAMKIIRTAYV